MYNGGIGIELLHRVYLNSTLIFSEDLGRTEIRLTFLFSLQSNWAELDLTLQDMCRTGNVLSNNSNSDNERLLTESIEIKFKVMLKFLVQQYETLRHSSRFIFNYKGIKFTSLKRFGME